MQDIRPAYAQNDSFPVHDAGFWKKRQSVHQQRLTAAGDQAVEGCAGFGQDASASARNYSDLLLFFDQLCYNIFKFRNPLRN